MKNQLFISFLLIFFFIGLSVVSAADNATVLYEDKSIENDAILIENDLLCVVEDNVIEAASNDDILASEITVKDGDSIQSAIDKAEAGSTIFVSKGSYYEDLVVSKELSIIGHDAVLKASNTAFKILPTANNTVISGFHIIVADINGTGIHINASGCKIIDNTITGGNIGIGTDEFAVNKSGKIEIRVINNTSIIGNNITNLNGAGISINTYNPIVCRNRVTNIVNTRVNGTAIGIKANGIGVVSDDLNVKVTDNYVSNIKSLNESAYGFDIGGNSVLDTLNIFDVGGNVVENVLAAVNAYGINIGVFSLNTTLPTVDVSDLTISHISTSNYENASATALSVSITTIGQNDTSDTLIHDINIKDIRALGKNSKAIGITTTGVGSADLYVFDNNIKNIKATRLLTGISATGVDYTNFTAFIDVSNNNITNLESSDIKAINVMSLGNAAINKNIIYNLKCDKATLITGVTLSFDLNGFNITVPENATIDEIMEFINDLGSKLNNTNFTINGNLTVMGNNLEGTGVETGFAVVRPAKIHYNRAVNLKYNVVKDSTRKFILESYDYDPDMSSEELAYILLKSQEMFENCTEEELRNMSISLGAFLDTMFGNLDNATAGVVDARFNWWGSNSKPSRSKFKNNNGAVRYDPWLVMRVNANPKIIKKGQYSKITVDVYRDSSGGDHSSKSKLFFSGPKVTLFSDIGSFNGKKSITLNWTNGKVTAYLRGDKSGLATVTASDYGNASTTVLILGKNHTKHYRDGNIKTVSAKSNSLPAAGNPLLLLVIVIMLLGSIGVYRDK